MHTAGSVMVGRRPPRTYPVLFPKALFLIGTTVNNEEGLTSIECRSRNAVSFSSVVGDTTGAVNVDENATDDAESG